MAALAAIGRPDKVELLTEHLIDDNPGLALEVLGCSSRLGISLGWHYILDIVWILKELEVGPGSVVLDAGAGSGLLQYILADRGYAVISADMMDRRIPEFAPLLYQVSEIEEHKHIEHSYKRHVALDRHGNDTSIIRTSDSLLKRVLDTSLRDLPRKTIEYVSQSFRRQTGPKSRPGQALPVEIHANMPQCSTPNSGTKPSIVYYHCNLNSMDKISDASVDAVVSVSALEHNPPAEVAPCLDEFKRVLKPGAWIHLTVSASHPHSTFHQPSHSWLLNEQDVVHTYSLRPGYYTNFEQFPEISAEIRKTRYLEKWLSVYYFKSGNNGMPWGKWDPQYVPMGIGLRASSPDSNNDRPDPE